MRVALIIVALCASVIPSLLHAQQQNILLDRFFYSEIQRQLFQDSVSTIHMGARPGLLRRVDVTNTFGYEKDSVKYYYKGTAMMFRDHFVDIQSGDFRCTIDPLFEFSLGTELMDTAQYADTTRLSVNSRGILVQANLGKKVSFQSGFYETQTLLPNYQRQFVTAAGIMPGMGRVKVFKTNGFDYGVSFGTLSFSPNDRWNFQMGYGKHFIGFGYRSMLWSDAAFNYPFLRAQSQWFGGKLEYSAHMAILQNLDRLPLGEVPEALFQRKVATFHYLSLKPIPQLEIGLFESVMWQRWDSTGVQPLPLAAYVPITGMGLISQGFDSQNNVVVGLNGRLMIARRAELYGQIALDNPSNSRFGYQAGLRIYNALLANLDFQAEWNTASDFLYTHRNVLQSYSQFSQPLGHPSGPGMNEYLGILNYRFRRILFQAKYNVVRQTQGPGGNWSSDPDGIQTIALFRERRMEQAEFSLGYFLNPKTNARIAVGYLFRHEIYSPFSQQKTGFFNVTFRTSIQNRYFDF